MTHADPVTPDMRLAVFLADNHRCVAPVIDPAERGRCWGRLRIEHVPDDHGTKKGMTIAGTRRGKRAPSDPQHLLTLCAGHTEDGMRAGHVWATANRPGQRGYLATHR